MPVPAYASGPFRILVLCTANQCRSPLVEFALRRRCRGLGLDWSIASCGTQAQPGQPPHPYVRRLLDAHGDDQTGWSSQRLGPELLGGADLVLASALDHRNQVVRLCPEAAPRTFLLLPFARFCAGRPDGLGTARDGVEALRRRVAEVRGRLPVTETGADLPDPIGRRYRVFRQLDRTVEDAADALIGRHPSAG
jgi:protein-tyrosine phosphatase